MRKLVIGSITFVLSLLIIGTGISAAQLRWNNHAPPFDFLFNMGMHIDTHQQSQLQRNGNLFGFLYIQFTGAVSTDGYQVATHADCNAMGAACTVGWRMNGTPIAMATLAYHVEQDHPTWQVARAAIPQPGSFSHFHWADAVDHGPVGTSHSGYLLELRAVDTFCFVHHDASMFDTTKTCEDDMNGGVIVRPGIDIATHVNIVGSFPSSHPAMR